MLKLRVLLLSFLPVCTCSGSLDLGHSAPVFPPGVHPFRQPGFGPRVSVAVGHLGLSQVLLCLSFPSPEQEAVVTASFGGGVKATVLTFGDLEQASMIVDSCLLFEGYMVGHD